MTTATPKLCTELFNMTGWTTLANQGRTHLRMADRVPQYDLSFLTQKLGEVLRDVTYNAEPGGIFSPRGWLAKGHSRKSGRLVRGTGRTPEDAAASLGIELARSGALGERTQP